MTTYRIARRIWPLSTGKLADLVYDTRIELRCYGRGPMGDCKRRRQLRRRMAVAWHAMRLWKNDYRRMSADT